MSFFSAIKHGLGFNRNDEFDDLEDDAVTDAYASPRALPPGDSRWMPPTSVREPAGELFTAVIELSNRWSPDFVRECLDTERQRRYLYDSLSAELRARLDSRQAGAPQELRQPETPETVATVATVATVETAAAADSTPVREEPAPDTADEAERLRDSLEQLRLSSENRNRALTDRIHALTEQVRTLEEQNEKLSMDRATRRPTPEEEAGLAEAAALRKANSELTSKLEQALAETDSLRQQSEQFTAKSKMSDQMLSELNSRYNAVVRELESARAQAESDKARLAEHESQMADLEEVGRQMEKVESMLKAKDARLAELQQRVTEAEALAAKGADADELRQQVDRLRADKDSLRKTIETNLYNQAHSENRLRAQIKKLQKEIEQLSAPQAEGAPAPPKPRRRRKSDDKAATGEAGEDFGYKPPTLTRHRDDDAQMSLF